MTLPVIAIRPEPGCSETVERAGTAGFAVEPWPLFETESLPWDPPAPATIDGLLLGSANVLRHAGPALAAFRAVPVYAVGGATATAAEAAGLRVAAAGRSDLRDLVATLQPPLTLLRITGEEHVVLHPPPGVVVETRIAYRSRPRPIPAELAATLRRGALVLLHSAAAARHFAGECDRLGVARAAIALAALAPRIAEAAGEGWRVCRAADQPSDGALLALARDMCHDLPPV